MNMVTNQRRNIIAIILIAALIFQLAPNVVCQAAETAWKVVVNPETPLDEVYFYAEDKDSDEKYFYGYIDGKIALMDSNYNLVKETDFTCFLSTEYVKVKNQNALVVRKGDKCGVISATGEMLIEPIYNSLKCYNGGSYILVAKDASGTKRYALLDTNGEELIGFDEYERLSAPRFQGEHYVIGGYDGDGTVSVIFDGRVICQKTVSGQSREWYSCYFAKYHNQDYIILDVWENDADIRHYMDCEGNEICAYITKELDDESRYVFLDANGEEIAGLDEYVRFPRPDFKNGHYVVSGCYGDDTVCVIFDGRIIYRKSVENGDNYNRCTFNICNNQECIILTMGNDEIDYYIDYEGNEISPYQTACTEWLNEKKEADEAHASSIFNEVSAEVGTVSELESKTAYTIITKDSGITEYYYWTEIKAKLSFEDEYGDDTYTNIYYSSIYDKSGRCVVAGRSFSGYDCINSDGSHKWSSKESFYILTDDGKLCNFNRDTGEVSGLFEVDDSIKAILSGSESLDSPHVLEIVRRKITSYDFDLVIKERWKERTEKRFYMLSSKEALTYEKNVGYFYMAVNQEDKVDVFYDEKTKLKSCGTLEMSLEQLSHVKSRPIYGENINSAVILDQDNHFVYILTPNRIIKNSYEDMGFDGNVYLDEATCANGYISVLFENDSKYIWLTVNEEDESQYSVTIDNQDTRQINGLESVTETDESIYWCNSFRNSIICIDKSTLGYSVKKYDIFGKTETISDTEESEMTLSSVFTFNNKLYLEYNLEYRYDIVREGSSTESKVCNITGVMDWDEEQCIDASDFMKDKEGRVGLTVCGEYLYCNNRLYNSEFDIIKAQAFSDQYYSYDADGQKDKLFIVLYGYNDNGVPDSLFLVDRDNETLIAEFKGTDYYLSFNYYYNSDWGNIGIQQYGDYDIFQVCKSLYDEENDKYLGTEINNLIYDKSQQKLVYTSDVASYLWTDKDKKEIVVFEKKGETAPKPTSSPTPAVPSSAPTSSPTPVVPSSVPSASPNGGNNFIPVIFPTPVPVPTVVVTESASPEPSVQPTEKPESSPTPSQSPLVTQEPDVSETPVPEQPDNSNKRIKKGQKIAVKGAKYKVEKTGQNRAVEYIKPTSDKKTAVTVPATVKIKGKSYKVTSIGNAAFKNNQKLKSVKIGKNVRTIGKQAFSGCKKLTKVEMGENVSTIQANAFRKCTDLAMITIPEKVTKIGDKAFCQCKRLRYILVKTKKLTQKNVGKSVFSGGYHAPRVKTDKSVWKRYSAIFVSKGMSGKALFVIDPVKLVI